MKCPRPLRSLSARRPFPALAMRVGFRSGSRTAAARERPELAGVFSQFSANTPQLFADVDRDKVLKQGVAVADVYQTLQAYFGGLFLNQFNRFGRQWRVFLQAEGEERL